MKPVMMEFYVPKDPKLLANLGEIILRVEHLNHIKKMLLKTIQEITPKEAVENCKKKGSSQLRKEVKKSSRVLACSSTIEKIEKLMERAEVLTELRNDLTHGIWAKLESSDPIILMKDGSSKPIPTSEWLKILSNDIESLVNEINHERLHGYIKSAVESKNV